MSDERPQRLEDLSDEQRGALSDLVSAAFEDETPRHVLAALAADNGIAENVLVDAVNAEMHARLGDDVDLDVERGAEGPVFDVEKFVRALPAGVVLCPHCLGMGAIDEQPPFDPTTHTCDVCRGHGKTRTGSIKTGSDYEHECVACNGTGWQPNEPGVRATPARPEMFAAELPPRDVEGRTPDDPDFDWSRVVPAAAPPAAEPEPAPA